MNTTIHTITENTTLGELISILGDVTKSGKAPTATTLREEAGEPIASEERCKVYANGYAVYDNGSGRTVIWVPSCIAFKYQFDPMKEIEKGHGIEEHFNLPEGLLESLPWPIAVTLIGDHRVEGNNMNHKGSRRGTMDFNSEDYNDKDGDAEDAVEQEYRKEYIWKDVRFGENPEEAFIKMEVQREILAELTPKQKQVFIPYFRDGYKQQQIADAIGISKSAVCQRLSCAVEIAKKFF